MHKFREAVESGDIEAAIVLLADDVVFHSPVAFKPHHGRAAVSVILRAVFTVFEDFRYVREIVAGPDAALVFEARVGERALTGCDFVHVRDDGLIDELMVMVRPLNGVQALGEAMAARLAAR